MRTRRSYRQRPEAAAEDGIVRAPARGHDGIPAARLVTPQDSAPRTRRQARPDDSQPFVPSTDPVVAIPALVDDGNSPAEPMIQFGRDGTAAAVGGRSVEGMPQTPPDAFETAAELFSFTEEVPPPAVPDPQVEQLPANAPPSHGANGQGTRVRGSRGVRRSLKRVTAASSTVGMIGLVALMTVGMTMPAEAVPHEHATAVATALPGDPGADSDEIQAYVTPAQIENPDVSRSETYSVASLVDLAGTVGISNFSDEVFTNDQNCAIQWPYAVGVPITDGFGMRDGRMHEGTDFTPGAGAQIQAIADGVVRIATDSGGAFGVTIVIDHVVNGQQVSSRYAHMEYGSRGVEVGDTVSVGQYIGRTGNTGRSFGAHLHLELLADGTAPTDALRWLRSESC